MADHAKFAAIALRLIDKNGRLTNFNAMSDVPADPAKPWKGTSSAPTVLLSAMAAYIPSQGQDFGNTFIDDELLKSCDEVLLVAGGQADLTKCHTITDENVELKVNWIRRLKPADLTLLYAIGVSR